MTTKKSSTKQRKPAAKRARRRAADKPSIAYQQNYELTYDQALRITERISDSDIRDDEGMALFLLLLRAAAFSEDRGLIVQAAEKALIHTSYEVGRTVDKLVDSYYLEARRDDGE